VAEQLDLDPATVENLRAPSPIEVYGPSVRCQPLMSSPSTAWTHGHATGESALSHALCSATCSGIRGCQASACYACRVGEILDDGDRVWSHIRRGALAILAIDPRRRIGTGALDAFAELLRDGEFGVRGARVGLRIGLLAIAVGGEVPRLVPGIGGAENDLVARVLSAVIALQNNTGTVNELRAVASEIGARRRRRGPRRGVAANTALDVVVDSMLADLRRGQMSVAAIAALIGANPDPKIGTPVDVGLRRFVRDRSQAYARRIQRPLSNGGARPGSGSKRGHRRAR
jgi:hypothetical protein